MLTYIIIISILIHLATHVLIPLNIRFSTRHGIVALPTERRIHKHATPEGGGLSFALPVILAQLLWGWYLRGEDTGRMLIQLAIAGLIALTLGLIDDKYESRVRYKIFWQLGLGILMYFVGYRVLYLTNPLGPDFILGWMAFPVTVLWYVIVINAINLIDGMDGLAAGISLIVSIVLLIVGIKESNLMVISLAAFLCSGVLAFLRYNFFPARIFLGETGAQFIALNIAAISTAGAEQFKGITSMTLMIPLAALGIPILDVMLAIFRRIRVGSIFKADKAHIHHTMLAFGLSQRTISIIVYFITVLFGLIAIGFSFTDKKVLFSLLLILLAMVVVIAYLLMRWSQKK